MRVEIMDAMGTPYIIVTENLDLLGAWLVETLSKINPTPGYPARVLVWPTFTFDKEYPYGRPDWLADTRILTEPGTIRTTAEFIQYLTDQVDRFETLMATEKPEHARTQAGPCYGPDCDHVSHKRRM